MICMFSKVVTHAQYQYGECTMGQGESCSKSGEEFFTQDSSFSSSSRDNNRDNDNTFKNEKGNSKSRDGFDVYQSKIEFARKLKEGRKAIDRTLRSSLYEHCDWRVNPLKFLKGEYCGKHYKIFGLNRHKNDSAKEIKKRYRKLSLLLHPDKNPGKNAPKAFSVLTEGYDCLMSGECKAEYDEKLNSLEKQEIIRRESFIREVTLHLRNTFNTIYTNVLNIAATIEQGKIVFELATSTNVVCHSRIFSSC